MTEHRREAPGENGAPVPRDMPDQQTHAGEDPWDAAPGQERAGSDGIGEACQEPTGTEPEPGSRTARPGSDGAEVPDTEVPDTDEAGTGRRGAPHSGAVHPEHPVPDEPSG
ncbi:hypothetical protein ACH4UM_13930 [Streptomyces sp. NPDC020801]|uniref:hypothetical protein n=1 Tax=unclassified Streptomyces TaxID=2593676 RepID=UPI00378C4357